MIGKIISINGDRVRIKLDINIYSIENIMEKNVIFEEVNEKIVGEVIDGDYAYLDINLIGEISKSNTFTFGSTVKPSFKTPCRLITKEELDIVYQNDSSTNSIIMGKSNIYRDYNIALDINSFFSNHFAILGNSGSGKSYSTSNIIQKIFYEAKDSIPFRTNFFS